MVGMVRHLVLLLCLAVLAGCASKPSPQKLPTSGPDQGFHRPLDGLLTSPFSSGGNGYRKHDGIDIAAPKGTPIRAIADGRVVEARNYGGYGLMVMVKHDHGWQSMYAHLSEIDVRNGQRIAAGDVIGKVGATGNATGPHLHLEIAWRERLVDPGQVFTYQPYRR